MFRSCHCRGRDLDGHFDETDLLDMWGSVVDTSWSLSICCIYMGRGVVPSRRLVLRIRSLFSRPKP